MNPSNRDKCIYNNHDANSHHNKPMYERNPAGCDGYFRNVIHVVVECDASDSFVYHAFNHMILDNGCPQNVAGNIWANNFIETLD